MKPNQLATLVLRLLGIYCLIAVIPAIIMSAGTITAIQGYSVMQDRLDRSEFAAMAAIGMSVLYLACYLVFGFLLIVRSVPWGKSWLRKRLATK